MFNTNHITIIKSKKITAANTHLLIMAFSYIRYLSNQFIYFITMAKGKGTSECINKEIIGITD